MCAPVRVTLFGRDVVRFDEHARRRAVQAKRRPVSQRHATCSIDHTSQLSAGASWSSEEQSCVKEGVNHPAVVAAAVLLPVGCSVSSYNGLVALDQWVQAEWAQVEIVYQRRLDQRFNTQRISFPTNILASFFGSRFQEKGYFRADPGAAKAPQVASERVRGVGWVVALAAAVLLWMCAASAEANALPPPPDHRLTDSVGLLSPNARETLNARLESCERQTGHQVVVRIGSSTGSQPLEEFATKTFESWRLGRKKLDDGLLIAVLAKDRKIAIEVGYGLEDRVPDVIAAHIINDVMAPRLKAGDADGALSAGVDATLQALDGKAFVPDAGEPPGASRTAPPSLWQMILLGVLGLGFLALLVTHPSLALTLTS